MTTITSTLNSALNSYTGLTGLNRTADDTETEAVQTSTSSLSRDRVSLSSRVTQAQAREYLGLAPTGRLSLSDFQTTARDQESTVAALLAEAVEDLGIDPDQGISLSRDSNGEITISETFSGKKDLEALLNGDAVFIQAFAGLSSNNEVLDYVQSLRYSTTSLADYLSGDVSDGDLLSLAARYSTLKTSDPLAALWQLSHSETPYTYVYKGENAG